MFNRLTLRSVLDKIAPDPEATPLERLAENPAIPITLRHLNELDEAVKIRFFRSLTPPSLLARFRIDPIKGHGRQEQHVDLYAEGGVVNVLASITPGRRDAFFEIELQDNALNGIDLNLILLNDPLSPRYTIDYDDQDESTQFGTLHRNLPEEERAKNAGLAPGQIRSGLGVSGMVLENLETFLVVLSHSAYFLEPLTYVSAWLFERRGFAYVRGHTLMDDIHREFQPGGKLHKALDGSTPFRQPDQWKSIRGRAWAIHDGILEAIGANWDHLRMIKQIGHHADVNTAQDTPY